MESSQFDNFTKKLAKANRSLDKFSKALKSTAADSCVQNCTNAYQECMEDCDDGPCAAGCAFAHQICLGMC